MRTLPPPRDLARRKLSLASDRIHHLPIAASILSAIVAVLFLLQVIRPAAATLTPGFSSYYTASRLVRERWSVTNFYDDDWFRSQTIRLGFAGADDIYNLNPPTTALLFWPLSFFPPLESKEIWTGINVLILGLTLGGLIGIVRGGPGEMAIGVVLLAFFQPVREDVHLGQIYALLLALEVGLLWCYLEGKQSASGLIVGSIVGLKTTGVGLFLLLVSQRQWRAFCWSLLALAAIVFASMLLLGIEPWLRYAVLVSRFGTHPELAVTAYQDLPGFFLHLFVLDDTWNRSPLLDAPWLGTLLIVASGLSMVAISVWATSHLNPSTRRGRALAFAIFVLLELALSPVSEDYHYILALAPIAILLAYWRDARPGPGWLAILVLGICLIGAPLPYKSPSLAVGGWSVLAYPKLYGALLLWTFAIVASHRSMHDVDSHLIRPVESGRPTAAPLVARGLWHPPSTGSGAARI